MDHDLLIGILGIAVTILLGFLGLAVKALVGINDRFDEMREELNQTIERKSTESRLDRDAIWSQLREHQSDDTRMHRELLDRLGHMATREDLYRATNDLKSDLQKIFAQGANRDQKLLTN